jgi:hypothetical protein
VIAPVLAAIGAYDCKWPPYASHIEFELWQSTNATASAYVRVSCCDSLLVTVHFAYLLCASVVLDVQEHQHDVVVLTAH